MFAKGSSGDGSDAVDEISALLRDAGLDPTVGVLSEGERTEIASAGQVVLARILASPVPARRPRISTRRRRMALTVACIVAIVTAGVSITGLSRGRNDTVQVLHGNLRMTDFTLVSATTGPLVGIDPSAELRRLADRADRQKPRGDGPVQHISTTGWGRSGGGHGNGPMKFAAPVTMVSDIYFLPDGKVRTIEHQGTPLDRQGRIISPSQPLRVTDDDTFAGPSEGPGFADSLPTRPRKLVQALLPDPTGCPSVGTCLTSGLAMLYEGWVVPPRLAAALWRTLVGTHALTYLGRTDDRLGRPTVAFASTYVQGGSTQQIFYASPTTGLLTAIETVVVKRTSAMPLPPHTVVAFTVFTSSRRIPSDEVPPSTSSSH